MHQTTCNDKEDERAHHVDVLDAHDEPVFLFHAGSSALDAAVGEVLTAAEHDLAVTTPLRGMAHAVAGAWYGPPAARVPATRSSALGALYVADGHHRTAAAVRLHEARQRDARLDETGQTGWASSPSSFPRPSSPCCPTSAW